MLAVEEVRKTYPGVTALADVSLTAAAGEIVCLLGPSGCGKTTLLRVIAGLETPDRGRVLWQGRDITGRPPHRRGFGLMFQDFALFPHRNAYRNVVFGLEMQGMRGDAARARVNDMLRLVGLEGYADRPVYELSGGEQQRVALARSLAPAPDMLMLDEPLGSLDRGLRDELMKELRRILKELRLTAIYVTHDQQEAFALADRILIMQQGRIEQVGEPEDVYRRPASVFVARFLGLRNLICGTVKEVNEQTQVDTPLGQITVPGSNSFRVGDAVTLLIWPEAASLRDEGHMLDARLITRSFRGSRYIVRVAAADNFELEFELRTEDGRLPDEGEPLRLFLRPDSMALLPVEK